MVNDEIPIEPSVEKESLNLSLNSELIEKIDEIIFLLKKQSPGHKKKKLNRSKFFEMLLFASIQDYENKISNSAIQRVSNSWLQSK
ncbi:MAG: hypothetical protein WA584_10370 [Pyrinomonadaceae bacterium]